MPVHRLHRAGEEVRDGARIVLAVREGVDRCALSSRVARGLEPEIDSPILAKLHTLAQPRDGAVGKYGLRRRRLHDSETAHHRGQELAHLRVLHLRRVW